MRIFRVVVLPAPFGTMSPRISLGYASRERPWRAGWPSYDFQSCCNSIAGNGMRIVDETRPRHLKGWMEFLGPERSAAVFEKQRPEVGVIHRTFFPNDALC